MALLPSERAWVESVADSLLDGTLTIVRGLPRTGKTTLAHAVGELLGESALIISGRDFDEPRQGDLRNELKSRVEQVVDRMGAAQIIFDDYGQAIRRTQGGALHSMLYSLLVDGPVARDVGALFTSRFRDDLSLRFAGSPLLSRARVISQPMLNDQDADALGVTFQELVSLVGRATALATRLGDQQSPIRTYGLVEHLTLDANALSDDLPASAIEVMLGARPFSDASTAAQLALLTLGSRDDSGEFEAAKVVADSGFGQSLQARGPGWPESQDASVAKFVEMLAGADLSLWIDRYLLGDIPALGSFLRAVRDRTETRIRLLTCRVPGADRGVRHEVLAIPGVEVRYMTGYDRLDLHDRQLVVPATKTGFVLPTAGVIISIHRPGSAVAVRIPDLPVDYLGYWRRATPVA